MLRLSDALRPEPMAEAERHARLPEADGDRVGHPDRRGHRAPHRTASPCRLVEPLELTRLPEHPDEHCSERPVFLAVDQELREGPSSGFPRTRLTQEALVLEVYERKDPSCRIHSYVPSAAQSS